MEKRDPVLATVLMLTYRHAPFIGEAIEGVLAQQCGFGYELLIADDCSNDGTRQVVASYIHSHPMGHVIAYTCHGENMGITPNLKWGLARARGSYIAICEGDDCWTDPHKLAKQVEFLESNPAYTLTCGGYRVRHLAPGQTECQLYGHGNFSFGLALLETEWPTKTLTLVFRKNVLLGKPLHVYKHLRDTHMVYLLLSSGPGYYFHGIMGDYRVHPGGVASMASEIVKYRQLYTSFEELQTHQPNKWIGRKYEKNLFHYYRLVTQTQCHVLGRWEACMLLFKIIGRPRLLRPLLRLYFSRLKSRASG